MNSNEKELNDTNNEMETSTPEMPEEVTEETAESLISDFEEAVPEETEETVPEEGAVPDFDADETVEEGREEEACDTPEMTDTPAKKKSYAPIIALIAVLVVAVAVAAYFVISGVFGGNKYNKMGYVNVSGRTVQDIADEVGIDVKDFLSEYGLPEDMPADTTEIAAIYTMPAEVYLRTMIGIDDFDTVKTELKLPDETTPTEPKTLAEKIKAIFVKEKPQPIDKNTPWYIVEGEMTVETYSGGSTEDFKEFYGLGEEVTGETKMKEIQDQINKKTAELLSEQQAAQENENANADEGAAEEGTSTDEEAASSESSAENSEQAANSEEAAQ